MESEDCASAVCAGAGSFGAAAGVCGLQGVGGPCDATEDCRSERCVVDPIIGTLLLLHTLS